MRTKLLLSCTVLAAAALCSITARASSIPAFSFTSATFATYDSLSAELGYDFTVGATPLVVSALGYVNDGFDGTHTVAIFDVATQQAVAGALATVTTVGGGSTSNTFTYTALASPVTLAAGHEYQIVSQFFTNEHYFINATGLTQNADVTFVNSVYDYYNSVPSTPAYARGVAAGNNPGDFGPNFLIGTAVTPEPSSLVLLGTGMLGLLGAIRKRYV